jgi:hypothetical protein
MLNEFVNKEDKWQFILDYFGSDKKVSNKFNTYLLLLLIFFVAVIIYYLI